MSESRAIDQFGILEIPPEESGRAASYRATSWKQLGASVALVSAVGTLMSPLPGLPVNRSSASKSSGPAPGSAAGLFTIEENFNEPIDDFDAYD
jgi:hypothetical protein